MKTGYILAAAVTAALSISSCADLGFGVDVDSGSIGPYWNDYGPYGGTMEFSVLELRPSV